MGVGGVRFPRLCPCECEWGEWVWGCARRAPAPQHTQPICPLRPLPPFQGQKKIYYVSGASKAVAASSPVLEGLKKKGYEASAVVL